MTGDATAHPGSRTLRWFAVATLVTFLVLEALLVWFLVEDPG